MQGKSPVWLVCLLGGIIGGGLVFAGNLQFHYSLWLTFPIGLVVGSLTAYLAYDWAGVKQGAAKAWYEVIAWRPKWMWWGKLVGLFFCNLEVFLSLSFTVVAFLLGIIILVMEPDGRTDLVEKGAPTILACALVGMSVGLSILVTLTSLCEGDVELRFHSSRDIALKSFNPIAIPFWILVGVGYVIAYAVKGVSLVAMRIPTALAITWSFLGLCGQFIGVAFVLIHTQGRMIVMVDTALGIVFGVALGLHFNNPLLGTLACGLIGAILGEVNYQIVSIRWLKVKPT